LLPDWQVAMQLGLSPSEMSLFLTIMDALRRPDTEGNADASRAIDEIVDLERWAHVYALPEILAELRMRGPERASRIRARIIDPIIEAAPEEVGNPLEKALHLFATGAPPRETFRQLESACRDISVELPTEFPLSYIDIEDYDVEALKGSRDFVG
jgi:hypothetical protein